MRKAELHSEVHTSFLVPSFLASWDLTSLYKGLWDLARCYLEPSGKQATSLLIESLRKLCLTLQGVVPAATGAVSEEADTALAEWRDGKSQRAEVIALPQDGSVSAHASYHTCV